MPDPYAITLPNLRANFLPDPGFALVEADLARADAQTIAWEAGAEELKTQLRNDEDIHSECALELYGHDKNPRAMHTNGMSYRDNEKRWQHGTNFAGGARTIASVITLPVERVERCQRWWLHEKHPALGELHNRIQFELNSRRAPVIYNKFGFRRPYVSGGRQANLLQQALAWLAQSTTACVINHALLAIDCGRQIFGQPRCGRCLCCEIPEAQVLLQIHDSILLQISIHLLTQTFIDRFQLAMRVVVPYDDPLIISTEVKWSAQNWGHMHKWTGSAQSVAAHAA